MGKHLSRTFALVMACALSSNALAQATYPEKPITLVVPFTPGSGSDIVARIIAKGLTETIKATVVIDNKPGANGSLGSTRTTFGHPIISVILSKHSTQLVRIWFGQPLVFLIPRQAKLYISVKRPKESSMELASKSIAIR